jgi:uncharacterized membrane protein YeaQ/YmgE (transglycosylase-associated protein family)
MQNIFIWLLIGGVAGWLAGLIVSGTGFGILVDILVGIAGAFIGGWLSSALGVSIGHGIVGSLILAVIGAVVLLLIIRAVRSMTS